MNGLLDKYTLDGGLGVADAGTFDWIDIFNHHDNRHENKNCTYHQILIF